MPGFRPGGGYGAPPRSSSYRPGGGGPGGFVGGVGGFAPPPPPPPPPPRHSHPGSLVHPHRHGPTLGEALVGAAATAIIGGAMQAATPPPPPPPPPPVHHHQHHHSAPVSLRHPHRPPMGWAPPLPWISHGFCRGEQMYWDIQYALRNLVQGAMLRPHESQLLYNSFGRNVTPYDAQLILDWMQSNPYSYFSM